MTIKCTQCGADVEVPEGEAFMTCKFCDSALYLDKRKVVSHFVLACTLEPGRAERVLRSWMAGNATVKDLDRKARITEQRFFYFPLWYFKVKANGGEKILMQLAGSTTVSDIKRLNIPAGDLKFFDPRKFDVSQFKEPQVLYDTALKWVQESGISPHDIMEAALIHVPVYHYKYDFERENYEAIVEGSSGQVFASVFPHKREAPYYTIGAIALALFLLEGFLISDLLLKLGVYAATGVPIAIAAYIIARKV